MASIVVSAEPGSWQQASRFAQRVLGNAELESFEALRRRAPVQPVLVFLTNTDYRRLRSLPRTLKPASPDVVIYYANRLAPDDAVQLGKRPCHWCELANRAELGAGRSSREPAAIAGS